MNIVLLVVLVLILALLSLPTLVFTVECLLGLFASGVRKGQSAKKPRTVILVPAHNEAASIAKTLKNLQEVASPEMSVLVVADNCSDDTADIVRSFGFQALERFNENDRGKGYALSHGIEHLASLEIPPEIVVIFDADCYAEGEALAKISERAHEIQRPVQACYLMQRGEIERLSIKFSEFAFLIKNKIRMRGAQSLGMPVPLTGTGMAFPWSLISSADLATGDIVEDMRLGVELAEQGKGAQYCDDAFVYSFFPQSEEAEKTQKTRWEHGHLNTIFNFVPRLLGAAFKRFSYQPFSMALDLSVPPFTLLLALLALVSFVTAAACFFVILPWVYLLWPLGLFGIALFSVSLVWLVHAREILRFSELVRAPVFVFSKLFIYLSYVLKRQTEWVRTKRD